MHGGFQHAVQEQRTGLLVDFVLDGRAVHRNFDDHVDVIWNIASDRDFLQAHQVLRDALESPSLYL
jgi:hypothetical protein